MSEIWTDEKLKAEIMVDIWKYDSRMACDASIGPKPFPMTKFSSLGMTFNCYPEGETRYKTYAIPMVACWVATYIATRDITIDRGRCHVSSGETYVHELHREWIYVGQATLMDPSKWFPLTYDRLSTPASWSPDRRRRREVKTFL